MLSPCAFKKKINAPWHISVSATGANSKMRHAILTKLIPSKRSFSSGALTAFRMRAHATDRTRLAAKPSNVMRRQNSHGENRSYRRSQPTAHSCWLVCSPSHAISSIAAIDRQINSPVWRQLFQLLLLMDGFAFSFSLNGRLLLFAFAFLFDSLHQFIRANQRRRRQIMQRMGNRRYPKRRPK